MKKKLLAVISVIVSVGLVAYLLSRLNFADVKLVIKEADVKFLIFALILTCAIPLFSTLRWTGILRAQGIKIPFRIALNAILMANVLNSFIPSKGGDIVKALYLKRNANLAVGFGTVILERLVDVGILGLFGLFGYFSSRIFVGFAMGAILIVSVLGIIIIALYFPFERLPLSDKIISKFTDLALVFKKWRSDPLAIAQTVFFSFSVWTMAALTVCCLTSAFHSGISWGNVYAIFPMCILAGLIPATISGIGTRDAAFTVFLSYYGATQEQSTLIALGYTIFGYWLLSFISLPAVIGKLLKLRKIQNKIQ